MAGPSLSLFDFFPIFFNSVCFCFHLYLSHALTLILPLCFSPVSASRPYFSPCHFLSFSRTLSSLLFSVVASRDASPSPLLVSDIILGSLLTLSSFTRFSLYYPHPPSRILLPILTLLPPSLSPCPLLLFCILSLWHHSLRSLLARYLKLYFILLFSIASIHLFFQLPTSRFYFTVDRDRPSRRRRRG